MKFLSRKIITLDEVRSVFREEILKIGYCRTDRNAPRKLLLPKRQELNVENATLALQNLIDELRSDGKTVEIRDPKGKNELDLYRPADQRRWVNSQLSSMSTYKDDISGPDLIFAIIQATPVLTAIGKKVPVGSNTTRKLTHYVTTASAMPVDMLIAAKERLMRRTKGLAGAEEIENAMKRAISQTVNGEAWEDFSARYQESLRCGGEGIAAE